jgi:glyoxylase-like metal-dependent hydrolase (beta-lactamase superfamily II)
MLPNQFPRIAPDVKFEHELHLAEYGVAGKVIHTPGHTAGSVSVMLDNGEAIIGDTLRGGYLGGTLFRHKPLIHYFAEDLTQIKPSLEKIMAYNPQTIYVGHGGALSADSVRRFMQKL